MSHQTKNLQAKQTAVLSGAVPHRGERSLQEGDNGSFSIKDNNGRWPVLRELPLLPAEARGLRSS